MYLGITGERTLFSIECLNGKNSKVASGNDLHIIHLREVVPPFVLLERPFDIYQSTSISPMTSTIDSMLEKVYEMNKDNDDMYKLFVVLRNPLFD
jgi:hypothetical protein